VTLEASLGLMAETVSMHGERGNESIVRKYPAGGDSVMQYTAHQSAKPLPGQANPVLRVLSSGPLPPNPGEMAASQRFGEIISALADTTDLVIIDSPPLLEVGDTGAMASRADGVLFVVNMTQARMPMLERAHHQLMKFPCRKLGLVVVAPRHSNEPVYGYYHRGSERARRDVSPGSA
jgi:Mrp family chromosome partitioning ATPase